MMFFNRQIALRKNINIEIDYSNQVLWLEIGSDEELHYSYETISNFYDCLGLLHRYIVNENLSHVFLRSANKKVWSMGGDLELFVDCIENLNKEKLKDYAYKCVKAVHTIRDNFQTNAVTVAIVEGNAFGGGLECALSTNYIIAEEQVKFSFPETLFGTFPGMGAYSFLTRRVGFSKAQEMIGSANKWDTDEMHKLNIVSFKSEKGAAITTALHLKDSGKLIRENEFSRISNSPSITELNAIVDIWLEQVMSLDDEKVAFMQKIVEAQRKIS